jgi:starch synthase/alpha-amylase
MTDHSAGARILFVTDEATCLPPGMGQDISAAVISTLFQAGVDVHVALPHYRARFSQNPDHAICKELNLIKAGIPLERIHLAEDRAFYYVNQIYSDNMEANLKLSIAFQRDVLNNIVPEIQPDLIHCKDWVTGLIPAAARRLNIPCFFTVHDLYTVKAPLSYVEDIGIDGAAFWQHLFYERMPFSYQETRESNPVDFLVSGIYAAQYVNTMNPSFLIERIGERHDFESVPLLRELSNKINSGYAYGIHNVPDSSFNPLTDEALFRQYGPSDHFAAKPYNKLFLQETLGLKMDSKAPVFFWPSRLDRVQKGCQLLAEILYEVVSRYYEQNLQVVFVANGEFQKYFKAIARFHNLAERIKVCDYEERLARLAYAASDFVLAPSLFELSGFPLILGPIYGALPVAYDTGGINDTIVHMDLNHNTGNGFLFKNFDTNGLLWAVEQAMLFYNCDPGVKRDQIERIMTQSAVDLNHGVTVRQYLDLYAKMLQRPLVN